MYTKTLVVKNPTGLQAGPARQFVETASSFRSDLRIRRSGDSSVVGSAKSLIVLYNMNVAQWETVELTGEGPDEQEAVEALAALIRSGFGELAQVAEAVPARTRLHVSLTSNAGVRLTMGGLNIWIDALHDDLAKGFSTLSRQQFDRLQREADRPDLLLFTHCHQDHYSPRYVEEAARVWPGVPILLPEQKHPGQYLIQGQTMAFRHQGLKVEFRKLRHAGVEYAEVPLYGIRLSDGQHTVIVPGDSEVGSPTVENWARETPVDLALMNFPWITLQRGRASLARIAPRHTIIFHLPFREDDCYGYRFRARTSLERVGKLPDVRLLTEFMQREVVTLSEG